MAEKEYIEREALLKRLCDSDPANMEDYYYNAIKEAPAADVVEVVRCKDCKHYSFAQSINRYECNIFNGAYEFIGYPTKPNDFCSYGERKG